MKDSCRLKVSIICVATLCGKIAPVTGLGSRLDRCFLEQARDISDASLIGASSLRQSDPEFRNSKGKIPQNRIRAIITRSSSLPLNKKIFSLGPCPFVFCPHSVIDNLNRHLGARAKLIALPELEDGSLDLACMLQHLSSMGVKNLLIEGGGTLNYHALQQGIVDEIMVTIAPKVIGLKTAPSLVQGSMVLGNPFLELKLLQTMVSQETGEIFLRYEISRKDRQKWTDKT